MVGPALKKEIELLVEIRAFQLNNNYVSTKIITVKYNFFAAIF